MNRRLLLRKRVSSFPLIKNNKNEIEFFSQYIKSCRICEVNILNDYIKLKEYIVENVRYSISDSKVNKLFIGIDDFTIRKVIKNASYSYLFIDKNKMKNESLVNILKCLNLKELRFINSDNLLKNTIVRKINIPKKIINNNINYYSFFRIPNFSKDKVLKNFVLDFELMKKIYKMNGNKDLINYYKKVGIKKGFIINLKQIQKFYNCEFDGINIIYNNLKYSCDNFVKEKIYDLNFNNLFEKLVIRKLENIVFTTVKTIILIHSGNSKKLRGMLKRFSNVREVLFLITIVDNIDINILKNVKNYVVYWIKNVGNDLVPSIKIYNDYKKRIKFKYVLKLHTKSNDNIFNDFVDKLSNNYGRILSILDRNRQYDFGSVKRYVLNLSKDSYNKVFVPNNSYFCSISFFFGRKDILNSNLDKLNFLLKPSLINNFYYDNNMFLDNSPVHSIERLISRSDNVLRINNFINFKIAVNIASHISSDLDLYLLENNINKLLNNNVDIYVYYTGEIDNSFKKRNKSVVFKKSHNRNLDFGKHFDFYKDNILKYDHFILTNDSIIFLENICDYLNFIRLNEFDFVGYLESKEIKQHYQSWLWYLKKAQFVSLKNNFSNIPSHKIELNFMDLVKNKSVYYKSIDNKNIFFNENKFKMFYNLGFRVLKKKQVLLVIPKVLESKINKSKLPKINLVLKRVPIDFDCDKYKFYNKDIPREWNRSQLENHYIRSGMYEFRKYSNKNVLIINPNLKDILSKYKISLEKFL